MHANNLIGIGKYSKIAFAEKLACSDRRQV